MRDVLFFGNYSAIGDSIAIAVCIINIVLLKSTYTIKQRNVHLFIFTNGLISLSAVLSMLYNFMARDLTTGLVGLFYFLRILHDLSLIAVFMIFVIYMCTIVGISGREFHRIHTLMAVPYGIYAVCVILFPLLKLDFYVDRHLNIHGNEYLNPFWYAYLYFAVVSLVLLYLHRVHFIKRMYHCLIIVMCLSFLEIWIEFLLQRTSYTVMTFTYPIMAILFLFHHNAYDTKTGTLDEMAFDAYIQDLNGRHFGMICLTLMEPLSKHMDELSAYYMHFNEAFFKKPVIFRIGEDELVLVYDEKIETVTKESLDRVFSSFRSLYDSFHIDYKIVYLSDNREVSTGRQYLEIEHYMKQRMPLNEIWHFANKDLVKYMRAKKIREELAIMEKENNLDDERIVVLFQPVLNIKTGLYSTAEALSRFYIPSDMEMVSPVEYIPIAEEAGLIHMISLIVLNKTCRALRRFLDEGYDIARISVNFAIEELKLPNFKEDVLRIIHDNNLPTEKIAIEVTESQSEYDYQLVKCVMEDLQSEGVKFYLDDFGTGYSNLERIVDLPIDIIKFDRSLTILSGKDEKSLKLVGSFSEIFKNTDYHILYEGVETEDDEDRCRILNAEYLQGFKYSKPVPEDIAKNFWPRALTG